MRENWADNARAPAAVGSGMMPQRAPRRSSRRPTSCITGLSRHQPHPRGVHARARPADAVRARRARPEGATRRGAAAVPAAAAVLERPRRGAAADRRRERAADARRCRRGCLLAGFYLNELLLKLTTRHDPHAGAVRCLPRHARRPERAARRWSRACASSRSACWRSSATGSTAHRGRQRRAHRARCATIISARRRGWCAARRRRPGRVRGHSLLALARRSSSASARELADARARAAGGAGTVSGGARRWPRATVARSHGTRRAMQ